MYTNEEIKTKRRELRISQRRLAALAHVAANTISRFELGIHKSYRLRYICSHIIDCLEAGHPIVDAEIRAIVEGDTTSDTLSGRIS